MHNERLSLAQVMDPVGDASGVHGARAHLEAPQVSFSKLLTPQQCPTHTSDALGRQTPFNGARRQCERIGIAPSLACKGYPEKLRGTPMMIFMSPGLRPTHPPLPPYTCVHMSMRM